MNNQMSRWDDDEGRLICFQEWMEEGLIDSMREDVGGH